jgi:dTDP-4-dehydrorhamnose 3,5-epimerase
VNFIPADLRGVIIIEPDVHRDHRGFFVESYSTEAFAKGGIDAVFIQDNHSLSVAKGVVRGMHFQRPPRVQSKLVRATRGAMFDVVVDLRTASPTFGQWQGFELSADNFRMLFVPAGFAHGFCTLTENTEVQYKTDCLYAPPFEGGIRWNDRDIAIDWPVTDPVLSVKDAAWPLLKDFDSPF